MSRTPKPLRVAVDNSLAKTPEVLALEAKGHEIVPADHEAFDLVIGPRCWKMDLILIKYLDLAIKAARGVKYPKRVTK